MVIAYTENNLVVSQDCVVEFINIILFHVDQSDVQGIILDQIAGADRAVFLQDNSNLRVLFVKSSKKLRKNTVLNIGGMPMRRGGLTLDMLE